MLSLVCDEDQSSLFDFFEIKNQETPVKMTTSRRLPSQRVEVTKRVLHELEEYHRRCLRTFVSEHYQKLPNGQDDKFWLTRLTSPLKEQVRLHLCVVLRGDIFDWTDREVGSRLIFLCKE